VTSSHALKVLLVGHACGPGLGSEPGITWNWAWQLSSHHHVWVICHPVYRDNVERFLREHPNTKLHFVWVTLPRWKDPWNPARGERGIRLHYLFWQHAAFWEASRLQQQHHFDLVHHVSWNTLSAPPLLWRLPIPFVWGPVGGGQTVPSMFLRYFGSSWGKEVLRTLRVKFVPLWPALRRAVLHSALILATNRESAQVLEAAGAKSIRLFLDIGILPDYLPRTPPSRRPADGLTLLWAGRLEPRKALQLALEALAQTQDGRLRLLVAGDGPQRRIWEAQTRRLGLQRQVQFLGWLPWDKMPDLFRQADAFLFTSLQDSSGSVVFEAMAHALPIITLDHQGVGEFVPSDAGIKVPVTTPGETAATLAQEICRLAASMETRVRMGEAAWAYARTQTWDRRAAQMSRWYHECLSRYI
jgi:glycosyltransferase involved in cell wall biosynthesis